jgi:hypothetical protein
VRQSVRNPTTGAVLDTETVSSFTAGQYLNWAISGNVLNTITHTAGAGPNAVLSGLFFDPPSSVNSMAAAIPGPVAGPSPRAVGALVAAAPASKPIAGIGTTNDGDDTGAVDAVLAGWSSSDRVAIKMSSARDRRLVGRGRTERLDHR